MFIYHYTCMILCTTIYEPSYNGIVLGPGVDSYKNRIINQTYEPIYSFGVD